MNRLPDHSDAEQQAALWAARLEGSTLTAAQRTALDSWLEEAPVHRALLSQYCQLSADLEQQLPLIAGIRELSAESLVAPKTVRSHSWSRRPLMAGAALAAAAAVALVAWLARPQPQFTAVATAVSQRQAVDLADGTRVELNAQTNLRAEIGPHSRRVRMAAGEAFFAVHKDPSRPFIVETPAGSVRVTGTQFSVRTESPTAFEVIVAEGSVQAWPETDGQRGAEPVRLTAGSRLSAKGAQVTRQHLDPADLTDALAWRQGQVVFKDTPLGEALARFARYHGIAISTGPGAAELKLGSRFSLDDLDGFLSGLQEALPVTVTRGTGGSVQVDRRPGD